MKQRSRHRLCVVFSRVPSLALSSAPSLALALRRFRGVLQPQIQNLRFWIFLNFFPSVITPIWWWCTCARSVSLFGRKPIRFLFFYLFEYSSRLS